MTIQALLKKYDHLQTVAAKALADVEAVRQQIVEAGAAPKKRARGKANGYVSDAVKAVIKVLQQAGGALPRKEIAMRLGLPGAPVGLHLQRALALGFVVRLSYGNYACAPDVPSL